jgi:hypothetical protein
MKGGETMKKIFKIMTILLCPMLLMSCATIVSGRSQKVSVNTNPDEAIVTVNGMVQKSPCSFTLDRTTPSYQVKIEKVGYKTVTLAIKRGINGWVFGNIIFGGIIGIVIDCASGSVYSFSPSEIEQSLVPENSDAVILKVE